MQPRVSEFARIFLVAAFLVLVAQGPSFSERNSQTAALGTDGVCTTCNVSTSNNDASNKTVEISKDGTANVKEDANDPCNSKNKGTKIWTDNKCDEKNGTQQSTGTTKATGPDGSQIDVSCKPGEQCGIVSQGSGGVSNPSAVQQYASGSAADAFLHTPPSAEGQRIIDSAFPGASAGAQTAYPISSDASNAGGGVSSADFSGFGTPDSTVPGTALDYSQPLNLNAATRNEFASLASPDLSQASPLALPNYYYGAPTGGFSSPGVPSSVISPDALSTGSVWNSYQPFGVDASTLSGVKSPSDIFFSQPDPVKSYAFTGSQFPITVVDGLGNTIATFSGEDYGITGQGDLRIEAAQLSTGAYGMGSLEQRIANTLQNEFQNSGADGDVVRAYLASTNGVGNTLAQDVASSLAQNESQKGVFTQLYESFRNDGGSARVSVTGTLYYDSESSVSIATSDVVQGPGMPSQDTAITGSEPAHQQGVINQQNPLITAMDQNGLPGTQSGSGARQGILNQANPQIVANSQSGLPGTQSGIALQSSQNVPLRDLTVSVISDAEFRALYPSASAPSLASVEPLPDGGTYTARPIQEVGAPYSPPTVSAPTPVAQAPAQNQPGAAVPTPISQNISDSAPGPITASVPSPQGSAASPVSAQQPSVPVSSPGTSGTGYAPVAYQSVQNPRASLFPSLPNFNLPSFVTDLASSWSVPQPAANTQHSPVASNGQDATLAALDKLAGTPNTDSTAGSGQIAPVSPVQLSVQTAQPKQQSLPADGGYQQPIQQAPAQVSEGESGSPSDVLKKITSIFGDVLSALNPITPAQAEPAPQSVRATVTGQASCYDPTNTTSCGGTQYEGGMQTASGERYTGNVEATAALQLGLAKKYGCGYAGSTCSARVTDLATGKSIVVRINDNGPLFGGRVIDLSSKAKELLGAGDLPQVKVEIFAAKVAPSTQAAAEQPVQSATPKQFVAGSTPGQAPQKQASTQPLLQNVSYCIGSTGCTIDQDSYINALCQSDTGCAAKDLGAVPDAQYPGEKPMNDPQERAKEYARQVAAAGAKSKGGQPADVDNCQYAGTGACAQLLDEMQKWNAAHPGQSLVPMLKNPLLVAEKLGTVAAQDLLKKAAGMSGGSIVEQGAGTVAENDAQRKAADAPAAPMLFVGTQQYAQAAAEQVRSGNVQNAGVSASSQAEGGNGYKDGAAVLPVGISDGASGPAQRFANAQKPFVFGKDGKLLSPSEAAQIQAKGEDLDVYEQVDAPNPFNLGAKETHVKDISGVWYAKQSTAAEYVVQKQAEAQTYLENHARAKQLEQKLGKPVSIKDSGLFRSVFATGADGSKEEQIGVLQTRSDAEARILHVAQQAGIQVAEKNGALLDAQGRQLSLKTVRGGTAPSLPANGWIAGGSGFVARNSPFTYRALGANVLLKTNQPTLIMHVTEGDTTSGAMSTLRSRGNLSYNILVGSDREGNVITNLRSALQQAAHLGHGQKAGFTGLRDSNTIGIACIARNYCSQNQMRAIAEVILPQLEERYPGIAQRVLGHDEVSYKSGAEGIREANAIRNNLLEQIYGVSIGSTLQYQLIATGLDGAETAIGKPLNASDLSAVHGSTSFFSTDSSGNRDDKMSFTLDPLGDIGTIKTNLTTDENGNLGIQYDYTPPEVDQPDNRSVLERARDAMDRAYTAARQQANDLWRGMFGQQQAAQQSSGGSQGSSGSSGGGSNPASAQQTPVQTLPSTGTQTSSASLICSPQVISADDKAPVRVWWKCPQGTMAVGSGFSTGGSAEGAVSFTVSTSSASVTYAIQCVGTQAPQTASCQTAVLHPAVSLVMQSSNIESGESVVLHWSSSGTTGCKLYAPPSVLLSVGGVAGTATSLPLTRSSEFLVRCDTIGSPILASTTARVFGDTEPALTTIVP